MKRRQYLTAAGAAGISGLVAGCSNDEGGNGNTGPTSDGNGGTTTDSASGSMETIAITSYPTNIPPLAYLQENGILREEMEGVGYDYDLQLTFEGPALFASGQTDIALDISTMGAARMASERDMNLTIAAKMMTDNIGWLLPSDSEYRPEQTGGIQATLDQFVADDATIGIMGWSTGNVPVDQILMTQLWDKQFEANTGDFDVVEANPGALPQLMKDGEVDMITNSPSHGSGKELMDGEFVDLFWGSDEIANQDLGMAPLINTVVTDSFMADHPDAVEATIRAWKRGMDWFYESAIEDIPGNSTYMSHFGTEDAEVAEFTTKWHLTDQYKDIPAAYDTDTPIYHDEPYVDDEWLSANKTFMDNAVDVGQAPENWEALLTYEKL